jgi:hypothetical protein
MAATFRRNCTGLSCSLLSCSFEKSQHPDIGWIREHAQTRYRATMSVFPLATTSSCARTAMAETGSGVLSVQRNLPSASQIRTVWSALPEMMTSRPARQATADADTSPVCPLRSPQCGLPSGSQTRTVWSALPEMMTSRPASLPTATAHTGPRWPLRGTRGGLPSASQTRTAQ